MDIIFGTPTLPKEKLQAIMCPPTTLKISCEVSFYSI
jgi:hypothetical protein